MKNKLSFLAAAALALLFPAYLRAFDLTGDTAIVIPQNAEESSKVGAQELAEYVAKISGKSLGIEIGQSQQPNQIVIGTLQTLQDVPTAVRNRLEATQNIEAFYLYCKGDKLYIVGKKRVAELWGVYTLLEEKLGVRWLKAATAADPGEYVPKQQTILLPDFECFKQPFFKYRMLSHCAAAANPPPINGRNYSVRNKFHVPAAWSFANNIKDPYYQARLPDHVSISGGHTTFSDAVPAALFATHPEYFSMIDGKRVLTKHSEKQYCISNPDVQSLVIQYLEGLYAKYPPERVGLLMGMVDSTTGWCECPECRKLDETETFDYHNVSTRFHKVCAKIADQVYAKHPDANLTVWAYHTYRSIPKNVKYDPRLNIYFCIHGRCYGHALDDPSCRRNVVLLNLLKEWKRIVPNIRTYEYTSCTPPLYVPLEKRQAQDLKFYKELGLIGWKEEALFPDAAFVPEVKGYDERADVFNSNWQWLYVTSKLLWDPELDAETILADIESKYYGAAYPAMKKYHDLRRMLWDNSSLCMGYPTRDQRRPALLNHPESKAKLLACLDEADKLAANDPLIKARVQGDRFYLERYWIKPNAELAAKLGKSYAAPTRQGEITIDGDGNEAEWARAFYTSDFKRTFRDKDKPVEENLKTTIGMLSDSENLYFLVTALEPDPSGLVMKAAKDKNVWGDDSIELFIMPPSAAQEYFHVAVNPKGVVYDAACPGNNAEVDLGVKAAAKVLKDRYVIELQVPISKIGKLERGELWRIHAARNRKVASADAYAGVFSLDGVEHHDTSGYRGIVMGSPCLDNGSLDDLQDKTIKSWSLNGAEPLIMTNGNAVKINSYGNMFQLLYMALPQVPAERKIMVSCKASGAGGGNLGISFLRYTDTNDPNEKNGYRRKIHPTENAGSFKLTEETKVYSAHYTIKTNEWVGLMLSYQGPKDTAAIVDDISLSRED